MTSAGGIQDTTFVRASALGGFAEFVEARGADPVDLLRRAGIDPAALKTPDMLVPFARNGLLLETAAAELGLPSLGLEWALGIPAHFPNSGPMLLLKERCGSFGDWMERSTRYWRLQTNAVVPQVVHDNSPDTVALRIAANGTAAIARQQVEHIAGKIVRLSRAILMDGGTNPARVRFRHERPDDVAVHDLVFRCPLEFSADHDEILFPGEVLSTKVGGRPETLAAVADAFLRHRIGSLPRYTPGVSTSTALAIKSVLGAGICSRTFIANALGTSPRQLQRLLAGEGTTYEDVLDAVRREMACRFLDDAAAPPIATIAGLLDFSTAAALTLAVRRWTGMTPSGYRTRTGSAPAHEPAAGGSPP